MSSQVDGRRHIDVHFPSVEHWNCQTPKKMAKVGGGGGRSKAYDPSVIASFQWNSKLNCPQ